MLIYFPSNIFSILMFSIGLITLQLRGYFKNGKVVKLTALIVMFLAALSSELRFGFGTFLNSFLDMLGASFLMFLIFIFVQRYIKLKNPFMLTPICDFSDYDELTDEDKEIIRLLKEGQKYDWIAGKLGIATSTLKKKVHRIFKILDVPDLIGFQAQFSAQELVFTKEELLEWKKRNLGL